MKQAHHENNCIFGRDITWRRLHFKREDDWSEIRYEGRGDFELLVTIVTSDFEFNFVFGEGGGRSW